MGFPVEMHSVFKPDHGIVVCLSRECETTTSLKVVRVGDILQMSKSGHRLFPIGVDIFIVDSSEECWVIRGYCVIEEIHSSLTEGKQGKLITAVKSRVTVVFAEEESLIITALTPWTKPENRIKI